jgi:hypothetical protein
MSTKIAGERKSTKIQIPSPYSMLRQMLSRYMDIVNSSLKPVDDPKQAVLQSIDFRLDFQRTVLEKTSLSPAEYSTPAFVKAGVNPKTECYYLSLVRINRIRFQNEDRESGYVVHHLAYPVPKDKKVTADQIKQDMSASAVEYLMTYGLEWIESGVRSNASKQAARQRKEVTREVKELEKLAGTIGEQNDEQK